MTNLILRVKANQDNKYELNEIAKKLKNQYSFRVISARNSLPGIVLIDFQKRQIRAYPMRDLFITSVRLPQSIEVQL